LGVGVVETVRAVKEMGCKEGVFFIAEKGRSGERRGLLGILGIVGRVHGACVVLCTLVSFFFLYLVGAGQRAGTGTRPYTVMGG
jgi:hypothetical protein